MRILFLVAKLHTIEPFGVMSLSPHLKRDGHSVKLMEAESEDLIHQVSRYHPDLIGYSVCTGSHQYYLALNRWLKKHINFVSVFGGPHPTFFPEMIHEPGVDAICRGEGELAFSDFCKCFEEEGEIKAVPNFLVKKGNHVESIPPRPLINNLDSLDFPDRKLYYSVSNEIYNHRVRSFLSSRGCPFLCTYCFNHVMDELYCGLWKHVRFRSPENLVEEIAFVVYRYPTNFVAFRESIFPLKIGWLRKFASLYSHRVGLPFYCHLRLDMLTDERVSLLAKAGCHSVNVGIETGNEQLRKHLLGRNHSNFTLISACKLLRNHGIKILANNMLGLPGSTFNHELETLHVNQLCRPDYSLAMLWQPYPRTKLAKYAKEKGYYDGCYNDLDFTYYNKSHINFGSELEKRRVENLHKLFAVGVAFPKLSGLIKFLTILPQNRIFKSIFRSTYLIFHQTEIFRQHLRFNDWILNLKHIIMEN